MLDRDAILQALRKAMEPLDHVLAMYEGGSAARGRTDEWSDIDVYLVAEDDKTDDVLRECDRVLDRLSIIEHRLGVRHPEWPWLKHEFFLLEDASEFLMVDLAVLERNAEDHFLEPELHGNVKFHFNKIGLAPVPLDRKAHIQAMDACLSLLKEKHRITGIMVRKELNRGHDILALDLYQRHVLAPLVTVLRALHDPHHFSFGTSYLSDELPSDVVDRLKDLYFVTGPRDLAEKFDRARSWFVGTMVEIEEKGLDRIVP